MPNGVRNQARKKQREIAVYVVDGTVYTAEGFREAFDGVRVELSHQRSDTMDHPEPIGSINALADTCPTCGQPRPGPGTRQILDSLPARGYVRQKLLIPHIVPFSAATLWRKVKAGEFPKPVKLSKRVTGWRIQEVRDWLQAAPQK